MGCSIERDYVRQDRQSELAAAKPKVGNSFSSFVGAILAILAFRWLLFEPFVIPSGSMIPTLLIHDHILVSKSAYGVRVPFTKMWIADFGGPKRGDVVVFKSLEGSYFMIKRVVGLARRHDRDAGRRAREGQRPAVRGEAASR